MIFAVYLFPALLPSGSDKARLLSGFSPPSFYSVYQKSNDCPLGLNCFKDFDSGLSYAQSQDKPILLDFTGYACVNCRKMEEHVWPLKSIKTYFEDEYVLISLYVDDKKELPSNQQLTVKRFDGGSRVLKNYGHKWSHFQTEFFQSNSQPYYVLMDSEANTLLAPAVGYTPNSKDYEAFLKCGLESLKSL